MPACRSRRRRPAFLRDHRERRVRRQAANRASSTRVRGAWRPHARGNRRAEDENADAGHLENVPNLQDVRTMLKLLNQMGLRSESADGKVWLNASKVDNLVAPYEMVKTMRASILVLGPLLARFGEAKVSLPGGCAIGARPVDQHIKGLQAMGAGITIEHGFIEARAKRLKGARIVTDMITVTGTENLLVPAGLPEERQR